MNDLKPCPFCGGKAKLIYRKPFSAVQCTQCLSAANTCVDEYEEGDGRKKAIEAWNKRASEPKKG